MNPTMFRLSVLTVLTLLLWPAVGHGVPSEPDSVHFCAFDGDHQWQRADPLTAAKRAADLNVGEPRTVRLIYFLPNDRPYRQEVVDSMKTTIKQVQTFYADQMEAHGYGRKTFRFETDEQGEPLVHRVDGQHPEIRYVQTDPSNDMMAEIFQVFDEFRNVHFIIFDSAEITRGSGGRRGKNGGTAWLDDVYLDREVTDTYWTFATATAHEIGHAFGLYHDFRDGAYIMSYGSGPDQLSACATEFLAVHPCFNPDIPLEETSPPSISQLSSPEYPVGTKSVPIDLEFSDSDGLHQVLLFGKSSNLVACRRSDGKSDGVISFDYSGQYSVFGVQFIFTGLSRIPVHSLTVLAVDVEGNVARESVEVREEGTRSRGGRWPARIAIISGNNQRGGAGTLLPQPLVIEVRDQYDDPLPQEPIQFEVIEGEARLKTGLLIVDTRTDASGRAGLKLMLGPDPETNIVRISTPQVLDCQPVYFSAIGTGAPTVSTIHGDIHTWHLPDGAITRLGRGRIGIGEKSVLFSPDGRRFAVASGIGVWLYDVETFRPLTLMPTPRPVESIALSPDGNLIAAGAEGEILLLNFATGTQTLTLPSFRGHEVTSVAFSPDGTQLAASTWFQAVELWDLATQTAVMTFWATREEEHFRLEPLSAAFSPDGVLLAAGFPDRTVRLWDVGTREHVGTLTGHRRTVRSVAFAPDGGTLASGSSDGEIRLWDTRTGETSVEIEWAHNGPVASVAFAPDGMTLWSGSLDRTSKLWDVPTGTLLKTHAANHTVTSVSLSPDGGILSSGSSGDGRLVMWDTRTGGASPLPGIGHADVGQVAVSPDGKVIATGSLDGRVRLWDARTGQKTKLLGFEISIRALTFSPDGTILAAGSWDQINLWNVETGSKIASFSRSTSGIFSLIFSPDGRKLAAGDLNGVIAVWDVATVSAASAALSPTENSPVGLIQGEMAAAHYISTPWRSKDQVMSLAFSPDGTLLASSSWDGSAATLWDSQTLTQIATHGSSHQGFEQGVSFSPDGGTLATIDNRQVQLLKVPTLELIGSLPTFQTTAVSFSDSNTTLASGHGDGTIRLWDAATLTSVATPKRNSVTARLEGHTDKIHTVVFSPDGSTLVSASEDGTVLLWDMSPYITPQTLAADFDGDGTVGFPDFLQFAAKFGLSQGDAGYDARFDLDRDGVIGFSDFLIFAGNFGEGS